MTEIEIHDVRLLKKLAKQAESLSQEINTSNPDWRFAYNKIAQGTALLWRLIDSSRPGGKLVDK